MECCKKEGKVDRVKTSVADTGSPVCVCVCDTTMGKHHQTNLPKSHNFTNADHKNGLYLRAALKSLTASLV